MDCSIVISCCVAEKVQIELGKQAKGCHVSPHCIKIHYLYSVMYVILMNFHYCVIKIIQHAGHFVKFFITRPIA